MTEYVPIYYNASRTFNVSPDSKNSEYSKTAPPPMSQGGNMIRNNINEQTAARTRCSDSTYRTPRPTFDTVPPYVPSPVATPMETIPKNLPRQPTETGQSKVSYQDGRQYGPVTGTPIKHNMQRQVPMGSHVQDGQTRIPPGWSQQGFSSLTSLSPGSGERATPGQYVPSPPQLHRSEGNQINFLQGNSQGHFRATQQQQKSRVALNASHQLCPPPSFNMCEDPATSQQSTASRSRVLPLAPPPSYATCPPTPTPFSNNVFPEASVQERPSSRLNFPPGTSEFGNTGQSGYMGISETGGAGTTVTDWSYHAPSPLDQRSCKGRRQVCPPLRNLSTDYGPASSGTTGTMLSSSSRQQNTNAMGASAEGTASTSWAYHSQVPSLSVPPAPPTSPASNNASTVSRGATLGARNPCLALQSVSANNRSGVESNTNTSGPITTTYQSGTTSASTCLSTSRSRTATPFNSGVSYSNNTQSSSRGPIPRTPPPTPASNISPTAQGTRARFSPSTLSSHLANSTFTTETSASSSGQQTSSSTNNETSRTYSTSNTCGQPTTTTAGSGSQGTTTTDTTSTSCTSGRQNDTQGTFTSTSPSSSGRYRTNETSSRSWVVPRTPPSTPTANRQSISPGNPGSVVDLVRNSLFNRDEIFSIIS